MVTAAACRCPRPPPRHSRPNPPPSAGRSSAQDCDPATTNPAGGNLRLLRLLKPLRIIKLLKAVKLVRALKEELAMLMGLTPVKMMVLFGLVDPRIVYVNRLHRG